MKVEAFGPEGIVVLRCVIMNPMTDMKILMEILDEQEAICRAHGLGKKWRKCMGIEPTRDGVSAPHRI